MKKFAEIVWPQGLAEVARYQEPPGNTSHGPLEPPIKLIKILTIFVLAFHCLKTSQSVKNVSKLPEMTGKVIFEKQTNRGRAVH